MGHSAANRELPFGDHPCNGLSYGLLDLCEKCREVVLGRRQQTTGQESFPREIVPKDSEHLMADIGLQAIKRQDDPALDLGKPLEAGRVRQREREQFVVAFEQMGDRARGDSDATVEQVLMHLRNPAVLPRAQDAYPRDNIQAKRVPPLAVCISPLPAAAGGGSGRWKRPFDFPIPRHSRRTLAMCPHRTWDYSAAPVPWRDPRGLVLDLPLPPHQGEPVYRVRSTSELRPPRRI